MSINFDLLLTHIKFIIMKKQKFDPKSFLNMQTLSLLESSQIKGGLAAMSRQQQQQQQQQQQRLE